MFYILVCFTCSTEMQLKVASVLSAVYALVMMIVISGTMINAAIESLTSPNVIFLITLAGFYLIAALLHPQEFFYIIPGALYFISLPSGYVILILYSLCNMNIVSWGTRELPKPRTEVEDVGEEEKKHHAKRSKGLLGWLGITGLMEDLKEYYMYVMGVAANHQNQEVNLLLKELIKTRKEEHRRSSHYWPSDTYLRERYVMKSDKPVATGEKEIKEPPPAPPTTLEMPHPKPALVNAARHSIDLQLGTTRIRPKRNDLINPAWIEDNGIGTGKVKRLNKKELSFWIQLLRRHLHPINLNKAKQEKIKEDLKTLRNNCVFAFTMMNLLWMVLVLPVQLLKGSVGDILFIPVPRLDDPDFCERFEPLGLSFLVIFGLVLILQFLAMLVHRWSTFLQLISSTNIRLPFQRKRSPQDDLDEAIRFINKLQSVRGIPEVDDINPGDKDDVDSIITGSSGIPSSLITASISSQMGSIGGTQERSYYGGDTSRRNSEIVQQGIPPRKRWRRGRRHRKTKQIGLRVLGRHTLRHIFKRRFAALARDVHEGGHQQPLPQMTPQERRERYHSVRERLNKYKRTRAIFQA